MERIQVDKCGGVQSPKMKRFHDRRISDATLLWQGMHQVALRCAFFYLDDIE